MKKAVVTVVVMMGVISVVIGVASASAIGGVEPKDMQVNSVRLMSAIGGIEPK